MGAEFNAEIVMGETYKEILKKWNDLVDANLYEHGHSYSGGIGMLGHGFIIDETAGTFDKVQDAQAYICEHHEKWKPAMAVRIRTTNTRNKVLVIGGACSS